MSIKSCLLFDVDGTLTRPRKPIETIHDHLFKKVCSIKPTYIVTGSSYEMLLEQFSQDTLNFCAGVYSSLGNVLHRQEFLIRKSEHVWDLSLLHECDKFVHKSLYSKRFGKHIDERPGMLNVSSVGRNANSDERKNYSIWESEAKERQNWVNEMGSLFPQYDFSVGGSISIDISPKGKNKSQILSDFDEDCYIEFYGDKMNEGGNDHPLKVALKERGNSFSIQINDYRDTYKKIKNIIQVGF